MVEITDKELEAGFETRRARDMAIKTFKTKREAISLAALGEEIAKRRLAVGPITCLETLALDARHPSGRSLRKSPRLAATGTHRFC